MIRGVSEVLISRDSIAERVRELGAELSETLRTELEKEGSTPDAPDRIVLIPVLTGAIVFLADLIRQMPLAMSMRMVSVQSYPGATTESKGAMLRSALPDDLTGRHVVIVDDIYDTGQTLSLLQKLIRELSPASLRTCVLLRKEARRIVEADVEHVGFDIPDAFVVGYGLDYNGHYRNLPDIMTMSED
ncbi:MAG: hypoxanthine phosphoribosyltransferase [Phycisphaeraceae bacterium]|nr:MAG: hypoxanthine phosphoribosyltransferase [Phycisphaeraceae bacterium]